MRRLSLTFLLFLLLTPRPGSAATCDITFSLVDEVVFSALAVDVDYSAAPGVIAGSDRASCNRLLSLSLTQFLLDAQAGVMNSALISISGAGGPPYPLPLMTCVYSGEVPLVSDFAITVTQAEGPGVPPPPILPIPTVIVSDITCLAEGCANNADCDDGNECTDDLCNLSDGSCVSTPLADDSTCSTGVCCGGRCAVTAACGSRGDCNATGTLDAGDPICSVLCLIGAPPEGADCEVGADCNCTGSADAGDPVCTVLRLIGGLSLDPCLP